MNESKSKAGRKPLDKQKVTKRLLGFIESGLNIKQACAAAGLGVSTLREWRQDDSALEEQLEAAREVMRAKILAQIKEAGKDDWRALECYLRLSFAEYRFGNSPQVNIALQQNVALEERDPERAKLIEKLEASRSRALATASEPLQLADKSDARSVALEAERKLAKGEAPASSPEPERLRERPPRNVIERCDEQERRMRAEGWKPIEDVIDVDEILGD